MSRTPTLLAVAAAAGLVCLGLGWVFAGLWQAGLVSTLESIGVTVALGAPGEAASGRLQTTAALGLAGPLGVLVHGQLDRLRRAPPPLWRAGADVALLLLGGNLGLGGATIATAQVAVPHALEASVKTGAVVVSLAELAQPGWALAGVVSAGILLGAIDGGRLLLASPENSAE